MQHEFEYRSLRILHRTYRNCAPKIARFAMTLVGYIAQVVGVLLLQEANNQDRDPQVLIGPGN